MPMSAEELKQLWIRAGGNPQNAAVAAAVALAESAGNPGATHTNSSGSIDRGLWQINSIHGAQSSLDPMANARAAIAISKNGATWEPWCTAYTDSACGKKGGSYNVFNGSSVAKFIGVAGAAPGVGQPGGDVGALPSTAGGGAGYGGMIDSIWGNIAMTLNVILNNTLYGFMAAAGITALVIGVLMISRESPVGAVVSGLKRAV